MNEQNSQHLIIIGVPTYKRPDGLLRLLNSLSKMDKVVGRRLQIIVADNEGDNGAGVGLIQKIKGEGYPHQIRAIGVNDRGVAAVRNALLHEAFDIENADYLAMIDDDEWVEPQWLQALLDMQSGTNADVVWGHVVPDFGENEATWERQLNIYFRRRHPDGVISGLCGTTSVLLSRHMYHHNNDVHKFDMDFTMTGGEDMEFFTRMKKKMGFCGAFASNAVSYEVFPLSRRTKTWALQRYFRIGTTDMLIKKKHNDGKIIKIFLSELPRIIVAGLQGILLSAIFFWHPRLRMVGLTRGARQLGKVSGLLGYYNSEYKVIHGK